MADPLIPDYRRRTKLQQPNYTRTRVPYRSPMDSEKMNLEAEQLRFDLVNLRAQTDKLKEILDQQLDISKAAPLYKVDPTESNSYVLFPGTVGNYLSIPDADNLDVTDLTIVARVRLTDWTPTAVNTVLAKWATVGNQRGFIFDVTNTGTLRFQWSVAGTAVTGTALSSVGAGIADNTWKWIAVTFDQDSASINNVTRFWTSNDGVTWTKLGADVTIAGVTSIFTNSSILEIGTNAVGTLLPLNGRVSYVSMRNGIGVNGDIGGVEVFRFDASYDIIDKTASTFTASTGQTVTVRKAGSNTTTLVNDVYVIPPGIPQIAAKVNLVREQVRRLEIAKGINA